MKVREGTDASARRRPAADLASPAAPRQAWVDDSPRMRAQGRALAKTYGAAAAPQLKKRSPNPRADSGRDATFTTEHHVIPHSALTAFADVMEEKKASAKSGGPAIKLMAAAMPAWDTVTISELLSVQSLTSHLGWIAAGLGPLTAPEALAVAAAAPGLLTPLVPAAPAPGGLEVILGLRHYIQQGRLSEDVAGTTWDALGQLNNTVQTVLGRFTQVAGGGNFAFHLANARTRHEKARQGHADADMDAAWPYYEWYPGNLFTGPDGGQRVSDPHDGFDNEAFWFLPGDHFTALKESYQLMDIAIQEKTNKTIKAARVKLAATFKAFTKKHGAAETGPQWKQRAGDHKWAHKDRFTDATGAAPLRAPSPW